MLEEADIWTALKEVVHPTYGMSLVMLQMVQAVRVGSDYIEVDLLMNCSTCASGQAAIAKTRRVLESLCKSEGIRIAIYLLPQYWNPPSQPNLREF